jgi:diketogulonate reductase-like aldo/keto reductase
MPKLIYGTAWKKHDTARLVATAIQAGFRGIDTACQPKHYDEALFRYLTQREIVPLTGTRSPIHMREDLAVFDFELAPPECEALDALL